MNITLVPPSELVRNNPKLQSEQWEEYIIASFKASIAFKIIVETTLQSAIAQIRDNIIWAEPDAAIIRRVDWQIYMYKYTSYIPLRAISESLARKVIYEVCIGHLVDAGYKAYIHPENSGVLVIEW